MADAIPALVRHCRWCSWFRLMCPACGEFFTNGRGQMSLIGYPMHYASTHLEIRVFGRLTDG